MFYSLEWVRFPLKIRSKILFSFVYFLFFKYQVGWYGYSDEKVKALCQKFLRQGYKAFKVKVGQDLEKDKRRCKLIRQEIGYDNKLMADANQVWDVNEAIQHVSELAEVKLVFHLKKCYSIDIGLNSQIHSNRADSEN
jgi:hypothetical protein